MNAVPFDTLKLAERLEAGGFTAEQSRTFASALAEAASTADVVTKADLVNLATKSDLVNLATKAEVSAIKAEISAMKADIGELKADVGELKVELVQLRADTKADMAELKADLLKWIVSAIGFQTVVTIGAVVTLMRLSH